jgi:DNA invertase Pin-like site-specific DNA recombinase
MPLSGVALYCRLSPRPDGQYEGVDRQEEWGRAYAERTWPGEPVRVFADTGISAANGDHRPGYESLRDAIARGEVGHVWCVEQSRLERQEIGWFLLAAELAEAGIDEVHTNRDGIVRVGDDAAGIKAVLAAGEVRRLKRRVNDALDARASQGLPTGAAHVGYRWVHGGIVPIPEVADALRWAAGRVLAGWSCSAIAREFDHRGIPTARGGRWTHDNVKGALTAPTVAGMRKHRGQVIGHGNWEPILDETTWRQLCAQLIDQAPGHRPNRKYLLSGLVRCGKCGHGLLGGMNHAHGRAEPSYWCHLSRGGCGRIAIKAVPLEEYVVGEFLAALDTPKFRAAVAEDDYEPRRAELAAELEAIEGQHVELAMRWANGDLPAPAWDQARRALDKRKERAQRELADVPVPLVYIEPTTIRRGWDEMTVDEKRTALGVLIERVVIGPATPGATFVDLEARVSIEERMVG